MATDTVVLYDQTSVNATALDTGPLPTDGFDYVCAASVGSGGTHQLTPYETLADGTFRQRATPPAAALGQTCHWGLGAAVATGNAATDMAIGGSPPTRARFTTGAAAASTVRLVVWGKRKN